MKKTALIIIASALLGSALTVFAQPFGGFTDYSSFEPWYRDSVNYMKDLGIMKGYPDGSFRPANNVNRAELAVMLKKLNEYENLTTEAAVYDGIVSFSSAQSKFSSLNVGRALYKNLIILAEARFRMVDGEPEEIDELTLVNISGLPAGYSIYEAKVNDFTMSYYVRFNGLRTYKTIQGSSSQQVDNWFGPYNHHYLVD